jgi:broad specificity phosphatase PhoE
MNTNNTKIWFIRHGESFKNINEIYGDSGQNLTEKGKLQCEEIVVKILSENLDKSRTLIIWHNSAPIIEELNIIKSKLDYGYILDDSIKGIYLGVANGISQEDLKTQYPDDALMLIRWQKKEIPASEFKISKMESPQNFFCRIINFISSCKDNQNTDNFIVLCTTSVMIFIINLIVLGKNFDITSYYHYDIKNGDYIVVNVGDNSLKLIESTVDIKWAEKYVVI